MHAVQLLPSPPVRGAGLPMLFLFVYASYRWLPGCPVRSAFFVALSTAAVKAWVGLNVPVWLISINLGNLSLSFSGTTSTRLVYSLFAYIRRIAYAYRMTASL